MRLYLGFSDEIDVATIAKIRELKQRRRRRQRERQKINRFGLA